MCDGCDNHFPCGCGSPVCLTGEEEYWNNYNRSKAKEKDAEKEKGEDAKKAHKNEAQ